MGISKTTLKFIQTGRFPLSQRPAARRQLSKAERRQLAWQSIKRQLEGRPTPNDEAMRIAFMMKPYVQNPQALADRLARMELPHRPAAEQVKKYLGVLLNTPYLAKRHSDFTDVAATLLSLPQLTEDETIGYLGQIREQSEVGYLAVVSKLRSLEQVVAGMEYPNPIIKKNGGPTLRTQSSPFGWERVKLGHIPSITEDALGSVDLRRIRGG